MKSSILAVARKWLAGEITLGKAQRAIVKLQDGSWEPSPKVALQAAAGVSTWAAALKAKRTGGGKQEKAKKSANKEARQKVAA